MTNSRILVVDDEPAVLRTIRTNLVARSYDVVGAETGEEAIAEFSMRHPDLVILDLMLPGLSGLEVCEAIRAQSSVPVLVLSARGEEHAKVQALDLGADDYLTKPFGIEELLARVRALLRRSVLDVMTADMVQVADLTLDTGAHEIRRSTERLDLTAREFDVLAFLMRNAGKVVTHRILLTNVWGPEYTSENQYLRVFINRVRKKIDPSGSLAPYIITEPGVGYRLVVPAG